MRGSERVSLGLSGGGGGVARGRPILVVEDDVLDLELTAVALKRLRVVNPLVLTRDGKKAWEYLAGAAEGVRSGAGGGKVPAVVLVDLKLPLLSGFELIERVKGDEVLRRVPVVVVTASGLEADQARATELGADAYVVKPRGVEELARGLAVVGRFSLVKKGK